MEYVKDISKCVDMKVCMGDKNGKGLGQAENRQTFVMFSSYGVTFNTFALFVSS